MGVLRSVLDVLSGAMVRQKKKKRAVLIGLISVNTVKGLSLLHSQRSFDPLVRFSNAVF
jgi:hypothetical protein